MKSEKLINAFGEINEDFVDEAAPIATSKTYATIMTSKRKRISAKAVLIAAALAVVLATTAFTYGDAILQFIFGGSIVTQVRPDGDGSFSSTFEIVNRIEIPQLQPDEAMTNRTSFDEIRPFLTFDVREPSYVPDEGYWDITAVNNLGVVLAQYRLEDESRLFRFDQYYAGPDAYINLATSESIYEVMIGDIEAAASILETSSFKIISLYWMKDGNAFELSSNIYDLDTLVAIAESV